MAVKIIKKTLKVFVKETVAFAKAVSKEFGTIILYINMSPLYEGFLRKVAPLFILVDPAPPVFSPILLINSSAIWSSDGPSHGRKSNLRAL